jgi:allantoinase
MAIRAPRCFYPRSSAQAFPMRHMSMESLYEYGSRAGLWRVLRAFERHQLPLTVFAVAAAAPAPGGGQRRSRNSGMRSPVTACAGSAISRSTRPPSARTWREAMRSCAITFGAAPLGWYTGRDSPQTRRLLVEHGGFVYDSDSYADDLPYWTQVEAGHRRAARACHIWWCPIRSTPMTCASPPRRASIPARSSSTISAAFDTLYREGDPNGLECTQDAVGWPALPPGSAGRAGSRHWNVSSTMSRARAGLDLPAHRHCPALDGDAPVPAWPA